MALTLYSIMMLEWVLCHGKDFWPMVSGSKGCVLWCDF